jgi:hypothetical protein
MSRFVVHQSERPQAFMVVVAADELINQSSRGMVEFVFGYHAALNEEYGPTVRLSKNASTKLAFYSSP